MALKGSRRFLRECYKQVRQMTNLAPLSHRALELGLGAENTAGHLHHAFGAAQKFFDSYPQHRQTIATASPLEPYRLNELTEDIQQDWVAFLEERQGDFGSGDYRYNWDKLRRVLTARCGGTRDGGGGGDNELEIALRLTASLF